MPVWLVAQTTFLEALRRKDVYVLLILLGIYALVATALLEGYPGDPDVQRVLFSIGLTFSFASAAILSVVLAARQVPKEIAQGTILPLLARPLTRAQFLAGKFLACWLVGVVTLWLFLLLVRLLVSPPQPFSEWLFVQTVILKTGGLAAVTAIGILLSLAVPETLNITLTLGYYFLWGLIFNIIQYGLSQSGGLVARAVGRLLYVFPHLDVLNVGRLTLSQAAPVDWALVAGLMIYAAGYAAVALLAACNLFEKRWI